jgi:hypothetical protein
VNRRDAEAPGFFIRISKRQQVDVFSPLLRTAIRVICGQNPFPRLWQLEGLEEFSQGRRQFPKSPVDGRNRHGVPPMLKRHPASRVLRLDAAGWRRQIVFRSYKLAFSGNKCCTAHSQP